MAINVKRLSKETYEKRYNTYVKKVKEWAAKGYNVTILSKSEFRSEYDHERRRSALSKVTAQKSNIIRRMAADSRELTKEQYKKVREEVRRQAYNEQMKSHLYDEGGTYEDFEFEEPEIPDLSKMTRRDVFDYGLDLFDGDYRAAEAWYNEVV